MTWQSVSASCHFTLWTMSWHTSGFKNIDIYYCNTLTAAYGTSTSLTVLCLMMTLLFFSAWTPGYVNIKCESNILALDTSVTPYVTHPLQLPSSGIKVVHPTASQQLIQAGLILRNFALTHLEILHHFQTFAVMFSLTQFGMEETWLAGSHVTVTPSVMCMD